MSLDGFPDVRAEVVELYAYTKELVLLAEEMGVDMCSYLQPMMQQRDAYDHLMRIFAIDTLDDPTEDADTKMEASLNRVFQHQYRAFFDVADYMNLTIRDQITLALQPYSNSCIGAVLPEYYRNIRAGIVGIGKEIAKLRGGKDVSRPPQEILKGVRAYRAKLLCLTDAVELVNEKLPALQEYSEKEAREKRQQEWKTAISRLKTAILAGLVVAALVGLLSGIAGFAIGRHKPPGPLKSQPAQTTVTEKSGPKKTGQ